MKLFLQYGYGMLAHTKHLISKWGDGAVILSPRDMTLDQMQNLSKSVISSGGKTFFDPQLFVPRGTHHGMQKYDYWPESYNTVDFFTTAKCKETVEKIAEINDIVKTKEIILPGLYCKKVNGKWLNYHEKIIESGKKSQKPLYVTICLSAEVIRSNEQIQRLLNTIETWNVHGIYLVAEHPYNEYLSDDPVWLSNLFIIGAALKLQRKQLIVGYATHQFLPFACTGAEAIATGTWLNVRMFNEDKFNEPDENSMSRRTTWYYCPQTLSEYQTTALGMAYRKDKLKFFEPSNSINSDYANILFSGAPPDSVEFKEQSAFRHYLMSLYSQCKQLSDKPYKDTYRAMNAMLSQVMDNLKIASRTGVMGKDRDFSNAIDATRTALFELNNEFGLQLEMSDILSL